MFLRAAHLDYSEVGDILENPLPLVQCLEGSAGGGYLDGSVGYQHVLDIPKLYRNKEKELVKVDLDICINSFGFSYSQKGWHPVTAFLNEITEDPSLVFSEKTVFYKFYKMYRPTNMLHLVNITRHQFQLSYFYSI